MGQQDLGSYVVSRKIRRIPRPKPKRRNSRIEQMAGPMSSVRVPKNQTTNSTSGGVKSDEGIEDIEPGGEDAAAQELRDIRKGNPERLGNVAENGSLSNSPTKVGAENGQAPEQESDTFDGQNGIENNQSNNVPSGEEEAYNKGLEASASSAMPDPNTQGGRNSENENSGDSNAQTPESDPEARADNVPPGREGYIGKRLGEISDRRRKELGAGTKEMGMAEESEEEKAKLGTGAVRKYKDIKKFIRWLKFLSAAGTSLGDIFVSFTVLFLTVNLEWIYSKFNKNYPYDWTDKIIFAIGWGIILAVIALWVVVIIIISKFMENPLQFVF